MDEILKADKRYRTKLFTAYLIGIGIVCFCFFFGLPRYLVYLHSLAVPTMLDIAEITGIIFLACFFVPACYLMIIGRRIINSQRMPWPGQKVIHDTEIIVGKKAVTRGKVLFFLGLFTIILLFASATRTHYFFDALRHLR